MKNMILQFIARKLREPSTSAGAAVFIMTAAPTLAPFADGVAQVIAGGFAVLAMLLNEGVK